MALRRDKFQIKLEAKAEQALGLCAVWCIGPKDGTWTRPGQNEPIHPVMFGTSRDPDEILRQARKWHWQDVDLLAAVWCSGAAAAEAVVEEIEDIASDARIKGRWSNMTVAVAEEAIELAAKAVGVKVFGDETRQEKLRQEIRRQIEKLNRR